MNGRPAAPPRPGWQRPAVAVLGTLAFVVAIEFLGGWAGVLAALGRLPPAAAALLAGGVLASYLLRAARVYAHFHAELAGRFPAAVRITLIHNALANLLPLRAGELSFPLMLQREAGLPLLHSAAALAWFRVLDLLVLVVLAIVFGVSGERAHLPLVLAIAALTAMVALLPGMRPFLARTLLPHLPGRLAAAGGRVLAGLPRHRRAAAFDLLLSAANWTVKLLALGQAYLALLGTAPSGAAIAVLAGEASAVVPMLLPGGMGTYEASVVAASQPFGVGAEAALQAAVALHLMVIVASLAAAAGATLLPHRTAADPDTKAATRRAPPP